MTRNRAKPRINRSASAPAPAAPAHRTTGSSAWWRIGLLVLAAALAYSNSLSSPFMFDDTLAVLNNPSIRVWPSAAVFMPRREVPTAGRPLVNASMAINYALGGLDVRGYHVWNVAAHLLCAVLVFACIRQTAVSPRVPGWIRQRPLDLALGIALVWALHPLNSEVVNYVTQRSESMMAAAYLMTVYSSTRAIDSSRRGMWQTLAVASCAAGMGCKESMVTAPVLVVLTDATLVYGSLKRALGDRWRFYSALASTWLVLGALLRSGPRSYSAGFSAGVSPWTYLLNQAVMLVRYLRLAIWPNALVVNYGFPRALTLVDVLPHALLIGALAVATLVALRRRPALGLLGAWFLVTLAPTSTIVPIATEVGAERRMYLPLVALVTLAVVGAAWLERRYGWRRAIVPAIVAAVATMSAATTFARNREYASPLLIAQTTLARWPTPSAEAGLGQQLAIAGRHDEAIAHLREAAPNHPRAYYHLGGELFTQGKFAEAIVALQTFVRLEPLLAEVVPARTMVGRAFMLEKKWPEATEQLRMVLAMVPPHDAAHATALGFLADALMAHQQFDEAREAYVSYLALRPDDAGAMTNLGISLSATGRTGEAVSAFRRAVDMNPGDERARRNLAIALEDQARGPAR